MKKKILIRASAVIILGGLSLAMTKIAGNKGIDLGNFDTKVSPKTDFYNYVNGTWARKTVIPASEASWGSFNELNDRNQANLHKLLDEALANTNAVKGSPAQMVRDFYSLGMDTIKLEKEGISPLKPELDLITAMKTPADLITLLAHENNIGMDPLFAFDVSQDMKDSKTYAVYLFQSGTGLPEKDYYLGDEPMLKQIREKYVEHMGKTFVLLGESKETAEKDAKAVMNIETQLATHSMAAVELRNINAMYNKKTVQEVKEMTPNIDWTTYFKGVGIAEPKELIVAQIDFMKNVNTMLTAVSMDDWKSYYRWHLIMNTAGKLNKAMADEHFNFYGTVLTGVKEQKIRWKRILEQTDRSVGDALGQLYVAKYFTPESKKRVNEMVGNLIAAYRERIQSRDWMSEDTKKMALTKLDKITRKLGYTDKWKNYTTLDIKRDSYLANYLRCNEYESKRNIAKYGQPVDHSEWGMTPSTINAYYNPTMNEIVFPAGIMQPPFFNPEADDAVNYGAMGSVIGHEITHGFDDEGSQFDADGNLKNWWTEEDKKKFEDKTKILIGQFNQYIVVDSAHVNGELTLGENIADLGGLTISYYALQHSLKGKPVPAKIDGFTAEQRFFISWAQGWRTNMRAEYLKQMLKTNNHAPAMTRVMGPLSNMKEFYAAFGVKEGDKMWRKPTDRAEIW
ncbi:MAG: M13 family metallopeptidase [Bacteroidia bacterium]